MKGLLLGALLLVARVRGGEAVDLPNLVLDADLLGSSRSFSLQSFPRDACELQPVDLCVGGPGPRKLLKFSVFAVNRGTADLVLGVPPVVEPPNRGDFVYSQCHHHYHFVTFARYELRQPGTATVVAPGQKRSFCVEDTRQADPAAPVQKKYCCNQDCGNLQGVQVGWGDLYPSTLPCQWIDVTGVPPGDYDLMVFLNTAGLLAEAPDGNSGSAPVTLSVPSAPAPRVKLRAPHARKLRVGHHLAVAWKRRAPGELLLQEAWFSRDGGATYDLLARVQPPSKRAATRTAIDASMVTDQAKVKVYVCTRNPKGDPGAGALQCGEAESRTFRIVP